MKYVLQKNSKRLSVIVKEFNPKTETFIDRAYIGSTAEINLLLNPRFVGCVVEYMGTEQTNVEAFKVRFVGMKKVYLDTKVEPCLWKCDMVGNRFFEVLQTKRDVLIAVASDLKTLITLDGVRDGIWALNPFHLKWVCNAPVLIKQGKIIDFVQSYGDSPEKLSVNADGLSIVRTPSTVEEPSELAVEH
jgi:hypothetical protein